MKDISVYIKIVFMAILSAAAISLAGEVQWPVKGNIDLSSGFCEYRPGHFHGGIDIRTGGKEGREIFAPADGYVWRIKYSFIGYGKGIYIKDFDGNIYVFGHLSRLSDRLEKIVKAEQYLDRKYSFDNIYGADSIPISAGELIAYSGQSGYGAPHIHFEKRNAANQPMNPLIQGFGLIDDQAPEITQIGFVYVDDKSLFDNGKRRLHYQTRYDFAENVYVIDSLPVIQSQFGIILRTFDRIRTNGPKLSVYKIKLFIDDYLYYESVFDSYDYGQTSMVDLIFDYSMQANDQSHWHRLHNPEGMTYPGSKSIFEDGGIYDGKTTYSFGSHSGRIEVYDAAGNLSELKFNFVLAPNGNLLDAGWKSDSVLYVQAFPDTRYLDLDRIAIYGNGKSGQWRIIGSGGIEKLSDMSYRVSLPHSRGNIKMLKIAAIGASGWVKDDIFLSLSRESKPEFKIGYELDGKGLTANVSSKRRFCPVPEIEVVYDDGYKKRMRTQVLSPRKFAAYVAPGEIQSDIVRFDIYINGSSLPVSSRNVKISSAGFYSGKSITSNDSYVSVEIPENAVYSKALVELKKENKWFQNRKKMVTSAYTIGPKTIPLSSTIEVSFDGDFDPNDNKLLIYRLNKKEEWRPLATEVKGGRLTAKSGMMGTFAVLKDVDAPRVKNIRPGNNKTTKYSMPTIRFTLTDDVSGIKSDDQVTVLLDGEWLIPEFDPETEILKTSPRRALKNGRHELKIVVTDLVGNERTVFSEFIVKK